MSLLGLILVLAGLVGYLVLLFMIGGFTYRTWIFDATVAGGIALATIGWATGSSRATSGIALGVGVFWFGFSRAELRFRNPDQLTLTRGHRLPELRAFTVDGVEVTERDLTAQGPALLTLYRGWWCPTSKAQMNTILAQSDALIDARVALFAGSVDEPAEARPIQESVGDAITILCAVPDTFLDRIGLRDRRGAPWYDRLLFGAARQPISMPAVILLDADGRVLSAERSSRLDDGSPFAEIAARL